MKKILSIIAFIIIGFLICALDIKYGVDEKLENAKEEEANTIKIGVILSGSKEDYGISGEHFRGIEKACEGEKDVELIALENVDVSNNDISQAIKSLSSKGADIIIATEEDYGEYINYIASKKTDILFYLHSNSSENVDNVITFYEDEYEARYLSGVLAGLQTDTGNIGYVVSEGNGETVSCINAFTIGVRSVNPQARVYLLYANEAKEDTFVRKRVNKLINTYMVDVISYEQRTPVVAQVAEEKGVYIIGYHLENTKDTEYSYLANIYNEWSPFYKDVITKAKDDKNVIANGETISKLDLELPARYNTADGVVRLSGLTENAKTGIKTKVNSSRKSIKSGELYIFSGPLCDNNGKPRLLEGEQLAKEDIGTAIYWFVDGVTVVRY